MDCSFESEAVPLCRKTPIQVFWYVTCFTPTNALDVKNNYTAYIYMV
jgi:hypothetical protein